MVGIIGGTGLYKIEGLTNVEIRNIDTPFGPPSVTLTFGALRGKPLVFLPRHGENHSITPSEINFRANIWALKSVGVTQIIGVSAVGSLTQVVAPGDLTIPNQYLDWTKGFRIATFFREGMVAHVSTAHPTCSKLAEQIKTSATELNYKIHSSQTYACVEGPRLGTRAESIFLINAGCDLVGMTNIPVLSALKTNPGALWYFNLGFLDDGPILMKINEKGVWLRSHLMKIPFGDQGFCVSKALFLIFGGYPEDVGFGEDHLFVWQLRQAGVPILCTGEKIYTSSRKYRERGWASTTLKTMFLTAKQAGPEWLILLKQRIIRR